ncbi:uncharacterized protein FOMMEDRAFT_160298 [Fomitiporia mediterranea MF3/22]|uniref:uncharacterized protein n=1 Tax=Fomitiporia mediterranea (strain MF3/22) TaxID=694068 RepID=UPI0004408674|nr:uncharacterized protein FOMMEDRAFT_160298 [Fomitiporia mediterranea MF3/22]EJC99853.1 hypothetical protein FOMMEDRAFT_160298 [Fomitiporia mediterranea MF3/22]
MSLRSCDDTTQLATPSFNLLIHLLPTFYLPSIAPAPRSAACVSSPSLSSFFYARLPFCVRIRTSALFTNAERLLQYFHVFAYFSLLGNASNNRRAHARDNVHVRPLSGAILSPTPAHSPSPPIIPCLTSPLMGPRHPPLTPPEPSSSTASTSPPPFKPEHPGDTPLKTSTTTTDIAPLIARCIQSLQCACTDTLSPAAQTSLFNALDLTQVNHSHSLHTVAAQPQPPQPARP